MPDLETQLRSYSEHLEREFPALTFEEIAGYRGRQPAPVRSLSMRRGLTIAVASAVVALVVVGLTLLLSQGEEEAPVATTSPELAPITGTVDWSTPPEIVPFTGTVDWNHVTGNVPDGYIVATPSGLYSVGGEESPFWSSVDGSEWTAGPVPIPVDAERYGMPLSPGAGYYWLFSDGPASVWRSVDGASWVQVDLPGLAGRSGLSLFEHEGSMWATTDTPFALWISDDGTSFRPIDVSEAMPPDLDGIAWRTWLFPMASTSDATIGLVFGDGGLSVDLGAPGVFIEYEWDPVDQSLVAMVGWWNEEDVSPPPGTVIATFTVEVEGNRLMVVDQADGTVVHEIVSREEGADEASLLEVFESALHGALRREQSWILIGSDGVARPIDAPWQFGWFDFESDDPWFKVNLMAVGDEFRAYSFSQRRGETYVVDLWTSTDGMTWSGRDVTLEGFLPADAQLIGLESFGMFRGGDLFVATVGRDDGRHRTYWVSDDGFRWDRVLDTSPGALLVRLDSFWVAYSDNLNELYVSTDLRTWQLVDLGDPGLRSPMGTPYASSFGDTVFFLFDGGVLIVELEP
jgi:hypothetical protein